MFSRRSFVLSGLAGSALTLLAPKLMAAPGWVPSKTSSTNLDQLSDRELALKLSTGLRQQQWTYAGQIYQHESDEIVVNEEESVRFLITNDTSKSRQIVLHGLSIRYPGQDQLSQSPYYDVLEPGQTITIDSTIKSLKSGCLLDLDAGVQRAIHVRACDQFHPGVA